MWISKKSEAKNKKLLKMSSEQFDKYMCKTYPNLFKERNLPMNQTCMCWGFDIGKGWYLVLDRLCQKLSAMEKITDIGTIFRQIKEKYGGARFYHGADSSKTKLNKEEIEICDEILDDLVSHAEHDADYICAECGGSRDKMISIGRWVYDVCDKCFPKVFPNRKEAFEGWKKRSEVEDNMQDAIYYSTDDEIKEIGALANKVMKRAKKEQEEPQKKYAK